MNHIYCGHCDHTQAQMFSSLLRFWNINSPASKNLLPLTSQSWYVGISLGSGIWMRLMHAAWQITWKNGLRPHKDISPADRLGRFTGPLSSCSRQRQRLNTYSHIGCEYMCVKWGKNCGTNTNTVILWVGFGWCASDSLAVGYNLYCGLFSSWIMSSYHMVCLLSLSWRPRSPHLVVWSVGVGAPTALWEEEAGCSTLLLPTVCQHSCTSAIPERCCSRRTMLHCGPRGTMLHLLVPSSTRTMLPGEHALLYIHTHQCNVMHCNVVQRQAMDKSFGHNSQSG